MQVTHDRPPQFAPAVASDRNNFCTIVQRGLSAIVDILCWIWEKFVNLLSCCCRSTPQTSSATQPLPNTTITALRSAGIRLTSQSQQSTQAPTPPAATSSAPQPLPNTVTTTSPFETFKINFKTFLVEARHNPEEASTIVNNFFQLLTPYQAQIENIEFIRMERSPDRHDRYIRITIRSEQTKTELIDAFFALDGWARNNNIVTSSSIWSSGVLLPTRSDNQIVLYLFDNPVWKWYEAFTSPAEN